MRRYLLPLVVSLVGCMGDPEAVPSEYALSLPATEAALVLELVNYPGTDVALLDDAVGLDARAARNIVAERNGPDGVAPSSDDVLFEDLAALDSVAYVGDAAFAALTAYAIANPPPAGESVEGVGFQGWESESVVYGVEHATFEELDAILDARSAHSLIDHRPYTSVTAMGPVAYVGVTALEALRAAAPGWWHAMRSGAPSYAGTFDGVVFDEASAVTAIEIANDATSAELTAHGVASSPASAIIAGRPYTTLAQVAARTGVGTATMTALRAYAESGAWGAACTDGFDAAVTPALPNVLFLSESDRPLEIVRFAGAGTSAPTAASVLALVTTVPGSTAETRDVENYFVALEPWGDGSGPAAIEGAFGELSDVIYVAVHKPPSDPYHAEVQVYLVGRTSCGDLVGVRSIAVET